MSDFGDLPSHPYHPTLICLHLERRGHEGLGVGLFWVVDDLGRRAGLDHAAFLHDDDLWCLQLQKASESMKINTYK